MKKRLKKAIAIILTAAMATSVGIPAFAADALEETNQNTSVEARLINLETGEIIDLEAVEILPAEETQVFSVKTEDDVETSNTVGVKVNATFPQSRLTDGDSVTGGGVDAYLYVDYSTKTESGTKYIRVDKVRGSWNPTSIYITMSGRSVDYGDGSIIGGNQGHQTPTTNSFSYTTGWDYTLYYPSTNYSGATAYSCATASMSGGSNYLLECFVRVDSL